MTHRQIVNHAYECFARGDLPGLLALCDPKIEWNNPGPSGPVYFGTHRGTDAVARNVFGFLAENVRFETFEPREFLEGDDSVAVRVYMRARVARNERLIEQEIMQLFTFASGKIIRFHDFQNSYAVADALSGS